MFAFLKRHLYILVMACAVTSFAQDLDGTKPVDKEDKESQPLSIADLRELYKLQQEHHELVKTNPDRLIDTNSRMTDFRREVNFIYKNQSTVEYHMLNMRKRLLPFVLFSPQKPNGILIIHTHGGPAVTFAEDTPHADVAYYVSNGYTVVCPNYIGSNGTNSSSGNLLVWDTADDGLCDSEATLNHLPYFALRDLYVVMSHVKQRDGSGFNQVFLRGGSYGSCMNSNFIRELGALGCTQKISGVHLSGGLKYPCASEVPFDVPLLITHGARDHITHVENAIRFALQLLYRGHPSVQAFISRHGDHHLMVPAQEFKELSEEQRAEFENALTTYTEMGANFVNTLASGQTPATNREEMLQQLEVEFALLKGTMLEGENLFKKIKRRTELLQILQKLPIPLSIGTQNPTVPMTFVGPTMAHLELLLGDRYVPDVRSNLRSFLKTFSPIVWGGLNHKEPIEGAGKPALKDESLFNQIVQMIWTEEQYLTDHPGSVVFYHTANEHSMRLYVFLNLWMNFLQGKQTNNLETMRLFASHLDCFETIDEFLELMRDQWRQRDPKETAGFVFNNQKGFASRALAVLPFLTGSNHNSASSSLYWFLDPSYQSFNGRPEAYSRKAIGKFFKALGIYSEARVERMMEIFALDLSEGLTAGYQQAVMQQIFMDADLADEHAYLCQMWGVELNEKEKSLSKPSSILNFAKDPIEYEKNLAVNGEAFTNPEGLSVNLLPGMENEYLGKINASMRFANLLQGRLLLKTGDQRHVVTYYKNPAQAEKLTERLWEEIQWDITDFVLGGYRLPPELFPNCQAITQDLRTQMGMTFMELFLYSPYVYRHAFAVLEGDQNSAHGLFGKMKEAEMNVWKNELRTLFAQNQLLARITLLSVAFTNKNGAVHLNSEHYCRAKPDRRTGVRVRPENLQKAGVQNHQGDARSKSTYIAGHTYLSLLAMAANTELTNPDDYAFFMDVVYALRKNGSGMKKYMYSQHYRRFIRLCDHINNPELLPRNLPLTEEGKKLIPSYAFEHSLDYAIATVRREAYDAKEGYNTDCCENPGSMQKYINDEMGVGEDQFEEDPFN